MWENAEYYATPNRFVFLIREMANEVIELASDYINISEFAEGFERKDSITRLSTTLLICGEFKSAFFTCKAHSVSPLRP